MRNKLSPGSVFPTTLPLRRITHASSAANKQPSKMVNFSEPYSDYLPSYSNQSVSNQYLFLSQGGRKDGSVLTKHLPSTNTDYIPSLQEQYDLLILHRRNLNIPASPQTTILRYVPHMKDPKALHPHCSKPNYRLICHRFYK